jgi:hypothetical protein
MVSSQLICDCRETSVLDAASQGFESLFADASANAIPDLSAAVTLFLEFKWGCGCCTVALVVASRFPRESRGAQRRVPIVVLSRLDHGQRGVRVHIVLVRSEMLVRSRRRAVI